MRRLAAVAALLVLLAAPARAQAVGGWELSDQMDPVDDRRIVQISKVAEAVSLDPLNMGAMGILCTGNEPRIGIAWPSKPRLSRSPRQTRGQTDASVEVTQRLDARQAENVQWERFNQNLTLSPSPRSMLRELLASRRLVVRARDEDGQQMTLVFDLSGLGASVGAIQKACSWR
jgi:hypothetical protein